jgi:hypothetical protein
VDEEEESHNKNVKRKESLKNVKGNKKEEK